MYIRIKDDQGEWHKYKQIKNLSFSPEVDVTGQSLPINEFYADIITADEIEVARWAYLYDDRDNLWAKYWIIFAERLNEETYSIQAQSPLIKLERKMLKAKYMPHNNIADELAIVLNVLGANHYTIHPSFSNHFLQGYCPKQTAKERLQWICFASGAYVKTFFSDKIEILPIDRTETMIPAEKTFWKPTVDFKDYVTDINITYFSFTQADPDQMSNKNEYVKADGNYYLVERFETSIHNTAIDNIGRTIPTTEIDVSDVTLVHSTNVDNILSRLAGIYFKRQEVEADVINNADYEPGQMVGVYLDSVDVEDVVQASVGFIASCDFMFGLQARSKLRILWQEDFETTVLIVNYMYNNARLGRKRYTFPEGQQYTVPNPYLDVVTDRHRYVYAPRNEAATGVMHAGVNTNNQPFYLALHFYYDTDVLQIYSVTEVAWKDEDREVVVIE